MKAKTIFLTEQEIIIYNQMYHYDNHEQYMKKYYNNIKITEYIPIMLSKKKHCVIDLSSDYLLGTIYLPEYINDFQQDYFKLNQSSLERYSLYLYDNSLEKTVSINELLIVIKSKIKKKD